MDLRFIIDKIKKYIYHLLDMVYPPFCLGCQKRLCSLHKIPVCENCRQNISVINSPLCHKCGAPLKTSNLQKEGCHFCLGKIFYFDRALSVCAYEGIIKTCIHLFKYQNRQKFALFFVQLMQEFIFSHSNIEEFDLIVAVPLHRHKLLERGFNQSEVLAKYLAKNLGLKLSVNNLRRIKMTKSQVELSKEERIKNVAGVFAVKNPLEFKRKAILLIDDIYTTGATLNECARVLKQSGATKVITFTLAR